MPKGPADPSEDWRPNLFVPGFPKCGTTALCDYLRQHPDIYVTEPKEPQTLAIGMSEPGWLRRHRVIGRPFYRYLTPEAYRSQLERNRGYRYRTDGSQTYTVPPYFPRKLKMFAPRAKLIFMVREQKERLLSLYYFMFKRHRQADFGRWIRETFAPEIGPFLYTERLGSYHQLFGDSMRVIDNRSLLQSPGDVMRQVFEFLQLEGVEVAPIRSNVGGMKVLGELQRRRMSPYLRVTQSMMSPYNYLMNVADPTGGLESKISLRRFNPLSRYRGSIFRGNPGAGPGRKADESSLVPAEVAAELDKDYAACLDFCRKERLLLTGAGTG